MHEQGERTIEDGVNASANDLVVTFLEVDNFQICTSFSLLQTKMFDSKSTTCT